MTVELTVNDPRSLAFEGAGMLSSISSVGARPAELGDVDAAHADMPVWLTAECDDACRSVGCRGQCVLRPWLNQIRCPPLVIAGSVDTAVPMAHAHMLAQGISGARLHVVDGAGHTLIWTHTEIFIQLVDAFLASADDT